MSKFHPCFEPLIEHLLSFLPDIDPRFPDLLRSLLSLPFTVTEDLLISSPGDVDEFALWPIEGFSRTYEVYKPKEDEENYLQKTTSYSFPGKVFVNANSFMNRCPVNHYTEILKGSTVIAFSYQAFQTIAVQIPEVARLALNILSDAEMDWTKRMKLCRVEGKIGYQTFLDTFTNIEAFSFQKDIASCIGVTPKTLSEIRSKGGFEGKLRK